MRFFGRMQIALDMGLQKKGRLLGGLLAYILLLLLTGVLLFGIGKEYAYRISLEDGLSGDTSQLCHLWLDAPSYEERCEEIERLRGVPGLSGLCQIEENMQFWSWADAFAARQEGHIEREEAGDEKAIYLGYELRGIYSVGDVIEVPAGGDRMVRYRIAGILKKGTRIFDVQAFSGDYESCNGSRPMDYMALIIADGILSNGYFTVTEGTAVTDVIREVDEIARVYGDSAHVVSIDAQIRDAMRESRSIVEQLLSVALLLGITSVFLVVLTQLMQLYARGEEFGIWYACGATGRDMQWVLVLQNVIRLFWAEMIAGCILFAGLRVWAGYQTAAAYEGELLFVKLILPGILILGVGITVIATLIPVLIFRRKSPVALLDKNA